MILCFYLKSLGLNPAHFNADSFMIGAATAATKAGLGSSTVMELGRWRSVAFHSYVRHDPAHPLTATKFRAILRFHLKSLGVNPAHFNAHSFMIGAATAATKAGLGSSTVVELGRWRSVAFHSYVCHDPAHPSATARMAKAN